MNLNFYYYRMKSIETGSWLIENLNPSTVLNAENVGLAKVLNNVFGTSLVPDIDDEKLSGYCISVVFRGFLVLFLSCYFRKEFSCIQIWYQPEALY